MQRYIRPLLNRLTAQQPRIKKALLLAALLAFMGGLAALSLDALLPQVDLPPRFLPTSILAAIVPALSVILVYELLLLVLAVQGPLVPFIRHLFQVVSLIVLRDMFKKLEHLATDGSAALYAELAVVAVGSLIIYFMVEVLERIEARFVNDELVRRELPGRSRRLTVFKDLLELALLVAFLGLVASEAIGWLFGVPNAGFNTAFLHAAFSGLIVFNFLLLFLSLLNTETYETLFEYSALLLSSVIVFIALPLSPFIAIPMILAALLFVLATLFLHGFARGKKLGMLFRQVKKS